MSVSAIERVVSEMRSKSESGAGSILALALIALCVSCFGITQAVALNLIKGARLDALADEIAISADDSLRGLATGYPCQVAHEIADLNMAILDECRIVGLEAFVSVRVQGIGIVLNATARAGPSS